MAIITSNKHQLLKSAISKVTSVWSEYFSRNANNLSTGAEDECTTKMSLASLDKFDNFFWFSRQNLEFSDIIIYRDIKVSQ